MDNLYYDPTDEDIAEFGDAAQQVAWANICRFYTQQGSLTGAGEQ